MRDGMRREMLMGGTHIHASYRVSAWISLCYHSLAVNLSRIGCKCSPDRAV